MRLLLQICENYGREFSIQFNAAKSACMLVTKKNQYTVIHALQFHTDGQMIPIVDEFVHLGHTTVSQLDDNKEILTRK